MKLLTRLGSLAVAVSMMMAAGGATATYAADAVTIKGEVIDTSCYAASGGKAKGESHRSCGMSCIKMGAPAGLLEEGTNKVYVLLPGKPMTSLSDTVVEMVAKQVSVTGKVYTIGGSQFLTVEEIK